VCVEFPFSAGNGSAVLALYTDNRINEPISLPLQSDQGFDHLQSYQSSDSQQETEENLLTDSKDLTIWH